MTIVHSPVAAYLGDAVYADLDEQGRLVLTTEDGIDVTNRIVFEPEVILSLINYINRTYPRVES